ncbi:MAG: L-threonylcarbamoyladenylate synthase [Desulfonatronovibrio sp.]
MNNKINQAARLIGEGRVIIYPTETFFALGGLGTDTGVLKTIRTIKGRPGHKPLPLVAGSVSQCTEVVDIDDLSGKLAEEFWPGPLSILVRAGNRIPYGVKDPDQMVSIRVTPHQDAAKLCLRAGVPLIATSANFSGKPSCAKFQELDRRLRAKVDFVLDSHEAPAGDLPSTLVRVCGSKELMIIRPGKISASQIMDKGWRIRS